MSTHTASEQFFLSFRAFMLRRASHRHSTTPALLGPYQSSRKFHANATHLQGNNGSSSNTGSPLSRVPQTHYEFFPRTLSTGPPPKGPFAIDLDSLRKEFYQLQTKAHPDRFPADQRSRAEGLSARINEAYKALQDPLKRAQYLLSLKGIDVAEDETAKVEDPELLMDVLETREAIEVVQEEEDLVPMKEVNDARIAESVALLDNAFARDDIEAAKMEAVKLRYWMNIKESLDGWEKGKPVVLVH